MNEAMSEPHRKLRVWRRGAPQVSLAEVHRSIVVPVTASFWRKMLAFLRPGFSVASVTWIRAIGRPIWRAGAKFGYALLVCRHDVQSHGDPAAASVHQTRRGYRTRSRPSVSRSLLNADRLVSLDSLRNRHRRVRSRGSGRLGHRLATSLRHSAGVGLRALPRSTCWLCFIFSKKVFVTSKRWSSR